MDQLTGRRAARPVGMSRPPQRPALPPRGLCSAPAVCAQRPRPISTTLAPATAWGLAGRAQGSPRAGTSGGRRRVVPCSLPSPNTGSGNPPVRADVDPHLVALRAAVLKNAAPVLPGPVPVCLPGQACRFRPSARDANSRACSKGLDWCVFPVTVPDVNWKAALAGRPEVLQRRTLDKGYEEVVLPQGLVSYVVSDPQRAKDAVRRLRASMQDRLISIDLEWKPDFRGSPKSRVALLQLSTATTCLLLRTSCMGYSLPPSVAKFLADAWAGLVAMWEPSIGVTTTPSSESVADPSHVVLGFGWDSADERKMKNTFGEGKSRFNRFLDLQKVAFELLGVKRVGLSSLATLVLGAQTAKSKSATKSNWAASQLSDSQVHYASMDALMAGQTYRALRHRHHACLHASTGFVH
ncbi:hypothetical protein HYH03_010407 [Edaphochlamys debaryana]|uniref:3'-5' exonuclease domain-containing protein n=1 Tax=Edaphochlamys debaryana TaxID=47281 RepID=A0A835XX15_9CHLO|nr:hypothetical protein HYH03_010407 [Edaphochlamys debaryana]|eukprot:KAG2491197.1 hypothetical protein HYH03_010407 [Edaphochlamys debaryana]